MDKIKLSVLALGILIAGIAIVGCTPSATNTITNKPSKTSTEGTKPEASPMVVSAATLVAEYDKNKLAAQEKYTGKVVQTTAFISNISSDILGSYFLALQPKSDQYYFGTTLQCYFADKSVLTSLSNGQSVTVKGTMKDMSVGTVILKDCSLVK